MQHNNGNSSRPSNTPVITDPELLDLMKRDSLSKAEQRRLMVKFRNYVENAAPGTSASALSDIIRRFPRIQNIPALRRYNNRQKNPDKVKKITTRSKMANANTAKADIAKTDTAKAAKPKASKSKAAKADEPKTLVSKTAKPKAAKPVPPKTRGRSPKYKHDIDIMDGSSSSSEYGSSIDQDKLDEYEIDGFVVEDDQHNQMPIDRMDTDSDSEYEYDYEYDRFRDRDNDYDSRSKKRKAYALNVSGSLADKETRSKIDGISVKCDDRKVDMVKVVSAGFSDEDNMWFHIRLNRIKRLEGKERYDLEDEVQRKFSTLSSLKTANLYQKFGKSTERNIVKDIIESDKSDNIKQIMINRMTSIYDTSGEEYLKAMAWFDTVMSIPTKCKNTNNETDSSAELGSILYRLKQKLDTNLYGMHNVKRQIMQAVTTIYGDPKSQGYIIALVGDPGVGKTTISSLIAETIGMGFGHVPCGSIKDQAVIMGHSSTYIGAKPGLFTQIMINTGQLNNVILLDEMDKLPDESMLPTLLQVLDKSQNTRFKDSFCPEIDIDMSKNMYIIAVNDISKFHAALKDRLKIIEVSGYDVDEKTMICEKHIIPMIQNKTQVYASINHNTIRYFVNKISPNVSGVRLIVSYFEDIYEKLQLIHRLAEYFKRNPDMWTDKTRDPDPDTIVQPAKRVKYSRGKTTKPVRRTTKKTNGAAFRRIIETQLNFNRIPPNFDLININKTPMLNVEIIEALEN